MIRNKHLLPNHTFETIGEININPHEEIHFFVGMYESVIPQPSLRLTFTPDNQGDVLASLVRIEDEGDYSLVYYFHNTGSNIYNLAISTAWSDE